jgi:hypothetical protein
MKELSAFIARNLGRIYGGCANAKEQSMFGENYLRVLGCVPFLCFAQLREETDPGDFVVIRDPRAYHKIPKLAVPKEIAMNVSSYEKLDLILKARHERTHGDEWIQLLSDNGITRRLRVPWGPRTEPVRDKGFFVLDPENSIYIIFVPEEVAMRILVLGDLPWEQIRPLQKT